MSGSTVRRRFRFGRQARWPLWALLFLSLPVFYYNLGNYGLVNGDEGFYHQAAANMVRSGDWLTIQWLGELRVYETFMNAPLLPWIRAAMIAIGGDNYWTMRLVSATAGMLAVIVTYRLSRQFMSSAEAFLAAILLMFSYQFVFLHGARTGELDAVITLILVWLVYSFVRALRANGSFIPHHLGMLALLTIKLPVIIVPVLFEAAFFALSPKYRKHIPRWALTFTCMVPFAVTWHVYQFIDLGYENVFSVLNLMSEQASGETWQSVVRGRRMGFLDSARDNALFYGKTLLFGGFPQVLLVPLAAIGVWRHRASGRSTDFLKLVLLAGLVVIVFFCFVARRFPWYVIPAYPFMAILVARFLYRLTRLGRGYIMTSMVALVGALAIGLSFTPAVPNPFKFRAMLINPVPSLVDIGGMDWRIYVPILMVAILVLMGLAKRVGSRLPVHALPALCIVLVVSLAGARVAGALRHTTHVSAPEKFTRKLASRMDRGIEVTFPLAVPRMKGGESRPIYTYLLGSDYKMSFKGPRPKLIRPLRPGERPSLDREHLKLGLAPTRGGTAKRKK